MGEIFDVRKQMTGRPGRPKLVRVSRQEDSKTKIVGAQEISEDHIPETLDNRSKVEQPAPTIVAHEERIQEGENSIRVRRQDPTAPQVQLRQSDNEAWKQVKEGD